MVFPRRYEPFCLRRGASMGSVCARRCPCEPPGHLWIVERPLAASPLTSRDRSVATAILSPGEVPNVVQLPVPHSPVPFSFPRLSFRPQLSVLEDRTVPATFTVTNLLDNGSIGSLRWAVDKANADPNADVIKFRAG